MKVIMTLTLVLMASPSYALSVNARNNMGEESAPRRDNSTSADDYGPMRRNINYLRMNRSDFKSDTICTGQASTRRSNGIDTPASRDCYNYRCVDKNGHTYNRNDSGYAACVNKNSSQMKGR